MARNLPKNSGGTDQPAEDDDLLLRETNHRCSNDLQLIVSLLALQSRRAANPEVREALGDAMERISILAQARRAMYQERLPTLAFALRQVCDALQAQAEPRSIQVSLQTVYEPHGLSPSQITILALVVNELATNAIKHAFEEGVSGEIHVSIAERDGCAVAIIVDDDGLPFREANSEGLGMGIAKRLMASIGGQFVPPPLGTKMFELRVPVIGDAAA